ncbi:hypothetical protein ACFU0W_12500 [Microbacterium keratanolyticum]|uniref:hypothetical protein n=1 Tax=Microbacterium keratanolyticum TaxID=67574 RepID=UPI00366C4B6C
MSRHSTNTGETVEETSTRAPVAPALHSPTPAPHRRAVGRGTFALRGIAVTILWATSVIIGGILPAGELRWIWLVGHLAALVVGLGAAVMIEYAGFLWTIGRGTLHEVGATEERLAPLAWLGFGGMLLTGMFLSPDVSNPLTALKMIVVLAIGLNAVATARLTVVLHGLPDDLPFRRAPWRLRSWSLATGLVSQLAWWSAVLLGTLNTASRGA